MGHQKKRARSIKQAILFLCLAVGLAYAIPRLWVWQKERHLLQARFLTRSGLTQLVKLEIAHTPQLRAKGLY